MIYGDRISRGYMGLALENKIRLRVTNWGFYILIKRRMYGVFGVLLGS